jgi:gliding motility-associated-like protein
MKTLLRSIILFGVLFNLAFSLKAQVDCGCTNCPVAITDNGNFNANIFIQNTGPNTLGVDNCLQSVCFTVTHTWIGDLDFTLTAPDGTCYIIMGDANNNAGGCGSSCDNLNVCIELGTGDPAGTGATEYAALGGAGANCVSGNFTIATGVTNPNGPCNNSTNNLNAFNNGTGTVSGVWTLTIGDNCSADIGQLTDWSVNFCDESGIDCSSTPLCLINNFTANISACNLGTYTANGVISFTNRPASGNLVVEDCNGNIVFSDPAPWPASGNVNYTTSAMTADGLPCDLTAYFTADPGCQLGPLNYTAPTCPCAITNFSTNISACDPSDNTFDITGTIQFQNPPASGTLTVSDCNGNQQIFNAPFASPLNYTLANIDSDGTTNCSVTAVFSASPTCTITSGLFNYPSGCVCNAEAGTYTDGISIGTTTATGPYPLCFGDQLDIIANGDYTPPQDFSIGGITYDPGIWLLVYDCPPTVGTPDDINTDPCLLGIFPIDAAWGILNNTGDGTTLYYVPVTMYSMMDNIYAVSINGGNWCYDLGPTYQVTYLPEITTNVTTNCVAGTATTTISGGLPSFNGSFFTASNLSPGTASFVNTTTTNGGNIVINGLNDGDNFSFDVVDGNGCPVTITGTFAGVQDASFTYPQSIYCKNAANPSPVITGDLGGTFTATPAGLSINASTGLINLTTTTAGTYTVTYTTAGPVCPDSETFVITINPVPTATIAGTATVCNGAPQPTITFTGANGTAPYTFTYNINGGANQTINSVGATTTINVSTATNGTFTYNLVSVQDASATGCSQTQVGSATITVSPLPTATIAGNAAVCVGATQPVITFTGANGTAPYTFTYNINGGANQTINSVGATATINVSTATSGTFTYNLVSVASAAPGSCSQAQAGTVTVTVNPVPTATIAGTIAVCQNAPQPTITFTGANGTAPYTFSYNLNGGATQTIVSVGTTATISVPTTTTGTFAYNLISVQDASATGCNQAQGGTATVTVNPNPVPVITGPTTYCTGTFATLTTTVAYSTYNWSTGAATASVNVTDADNPITVSVTNAFGCPGTSAPFNVTENSVLTYDETIEICQGESALIHGNNETVPGLYSQTFISGNGCDSTANITLVVNPLPIINAGTDFAVCATDPITLNATGAPTIVWNNGVTNGIPFTQAVGSVIYAATGTDVNGCVNTDNIQVTVNPLPTATIAGTNEVCINGADQTITLTGANGAAPYTFTYTMNGGAQQTITSAGNTATITLTPSSVGTFTYSLVSVEDASVTTCSQNQTGNAVITVNALPNVIAGNDFTACEDDVVVLTGSGATIYVWDNGVTNGVGFTPTSTTAYTVIGTDANGCQNTDEITVTIDPLPVVSFVADVTSGCVPLTVTFTNTTPGTLTNCVWSLGNGTTLTGCGSVTTTFTQPGLFDVTLTTTNNNGCTNSETYSDYIYVEAIPVAGFIPSSSIVSILNTTIEFDNTSVNATNYTWDFGDESPVSNQENPTHTYFSEDPRNYFVELIATSSLGCADTVTRVIIVQDEVIFYVPNTFTPDNDDYNEYFQAIFTSGYDPFDFNLYIFNRWGELIWESHDATVGWDGTYGVDRSLPVQDGTYTWKIDFKTSINDERIEVVGHVNVIR